ncbi:phosphatase phospho-type [Suillus paluster]|uniref:phosphatase phospho-type n=1 Tax=Suillus paluster TaxID=48578 RepID=UPI001B87CF92|nr:phosphatase phospho-type [Suillus paluster]KAG1729202.1 phosphatase phospho-type [Suillus paluster]
MTSPIKSQLVVFDFDWSMADQDTDRWIFEVLAPDIRRKMKTLKDSVQWTDLIAQSLQELHARGGTREQIEDALRKMPFHPAMVRGVTNLKGASNPTTTFFCLSNANAVFISTILESKGLQNLFEEIVTNPAEFDPSGLLKLRRRVDPNGPQHSCTVGCSPNMCKGEELTAFLELHKPGYDRIIYVGDGSNDFCPILRLRSQDMVLCRRFRGLERRISQEGGQQCQVKYWAGAWEVEEIFNQLIEQN